MPTAGKFVTASTALGLTLASAVMPAFAQGADFEDAKLEAFVVASLRVQEVRQAYEGRLAEADTQDAQQQIVQEANAAMAAAVEETPGIGVEEYIAVGEAAAQDPALNQRIGAIAQQRAE